MTSNFLLWRRGAAWAGRVVLLGWLGLNAPLAMADAAPAATASTDANAPSEGDKAWRAVRKATQAPLPPAEWQTTPPSREDVAKFYTGALLKGADAAKDFYTKYPTHPKAADARKQEYDLLSIASQHYASKAATDRLAPLTTARLSDPNLGEDERYEIRLAALKQLMSGLPKTEDELLKSARALEKDFPRHDDGYRIMLMVLGDSEGDKAQTLAKEITDSGAPDEIKAEAKGVLKKLDAVGKPLDIQFTAVDGREVNVANMKGKVVLVDFWATWCGPCMGEVPNVKAAFEKLHPKGFEIVGISFDQDKDALDKTLKEKGMTWPQYFDGKGWQNKYGQQFGINGIPTMWLVDKKGNLRDVNARGELEEKVTKLLAE